MINQELVRTFLFVCACSTITCITLNTSAKAETIRSLSLVSVNWEPYYGDNLLNQGYIAELTKTAFEREGYKVKFTFLPWKRALKHAALGRYDGLLGAYLTEERTKNFVYSKPISEVQTVLLSLKKSSIQFDELRQLSPYKIGVIRGASGGGVFDAATYLNKIPVDLPDQNIEKLINGRIDMIFSGKEHIIRSLNHKLPNWDRLIKIHQPAVQENLIYNAISKMVTNPEKIINAFNRGFTKIKADGTFDEILAKHGYR
ncbi:substrate-binding periplasmic protein [Curvivirga sp.]|uniref:substrate-binding periplasmic protein n=1 Tax=Curvivirga sp. TaxID=2856848 RepID=UPI003B5AF274